MNRKALIWYVMQLKELNTQRLTKEQDDLVLAITKLCNIDNMHVKHCDITYYMVECDRLGLKHMKQDLIDKSNEISIDLFDTV